MFGFRSVSRRRSNVYDGTEIRFGDYSVSVHHTPDIARAVSACRFASHVRRDTLFAGRSPHRLPGRRVRHPDARESRAVLFALGDASIVHQDRSDTTIGRERSTNPFVAGVLA